jgi:hypothetical protein
MAPASLLGSDTNLSKGAFAAGTAAFDPSDKSGPHATSGEKRKRYAANIPLALRDVHHPAGVLIDVVAQHVSDHVVAEGERRVVVEQVSETENFPVAAIAVAN